MAKVRLKPVAKIIIMVLFAGLMVGGYILFSPLIAPEGDKEGDVKGLMAENLPSKNHKCIEIGVVTWGGYAGGQYWNNGFKDNPGSKFHKDDICVNFHVMDDFAASRAAFKSDNMDLMWVTIDAFPTESGSFGEPVKFLFQADWSRGGDAIVTKGNINSVGELAGKKIAVAEATPSHTFLLWMLDMAGLSFMDVDIVKVDSAIKAAEAFKGGQVDAAVVWSPDDDACLAAVNGSKILVNTKQATHIIADGFMVKESYYQNNKEKLSKLVKGWLLGSAEINESETAKKKAAKILSDGLGASVNEEFAINAINNVRLTTYGDNLDFFGLNQDYTGVTGKTIYEKMTTVYSKLNLSKDALPYNKIVDADFIKNLDLQQSKAAIAEEKVEFAAPTVEHKTVQAVASKPVRVSFEHGSAILDENAKHLIDLMFVEQAKAFPTSRIRIEGNTDSTGSLATNKRISEQRAQAVVDYLINSHNMDKNRFVVVGNGPDKPLCQDTSPACMAKNRRTDFQILAN